MLGISKHLFKMALSLIFISAFISSSVQAIPVTIDFSSGSYSSQTGSTLVNQYTEDGFIVRTVSALDNFYSASGSYGGSLQWFKDQDMFGTTNNMIEIVSADGSLFDLLSTDIIAGFAGVTFTGSTGMTLTGGGSNNTRTFGADWSNLSSLILSIPTNSRILTIVDNIALNTHPVSVPEPAALLLLLVGMMSLVVTVRVSQR